MAFSKKEREYYNQHREHVTRELGVDKNKYNAFRRASHGLTKADTDYANYGDEKKHHTESVKHLAKAGALAKKAGLHIYHQSDPRGVALYLAKKRMKDTSYSSEGKAIH